jgi:hypothetical protein
MNRQKKITLKGSEMSEELMAKTHLVMGYSDSFIFDYEGYSMQTRYTEINGKRKNDTYEITFYYRDWVMSKKNVAKALTLVDQKIERVIDAMDDDLNVREQIATFHDYLIKNVTYDLTFKYCHTAYGAMISKKAVCDGFAFAMQYFCEELGIPCVIVTGDTDNPDLGHAWNKVKIGNNWYVVDVSGDNNDDLIPDFAAKSYLFLADSEYKAARETNTPELNEPKATDTTKSYYELTKASFSDYTSALNYVAAKAKGKLPKFVAVQITNKTEFNKFINNFWDDIYKKGVFKGLSSVGCYYWQFDDSGAIIMQFYQE